MSAESSIQGRKATEALTRFVCVSVYAAVLFLLIRDYASIEWWVYGFSYARPTTVEMLAFGIFLFATAAYIPPSIRSPSSLVLIVVYLLVIVPAGVSAVGMHLLDDGTNYWFLVSIGASYIVACHINRHDADFLTSPKRRPHVLLIPLFAGFAGLLMLYLAYRFSDVMSFASLDALYEQRARGAAESLLEGYAQTYSQYVFSTGLVAFGLVRKNLWLIALGLAGSVVNFMITAEKAGLTYPVFIIGLYFMLKSGRTFARDIRAISMAFAGVLFVAIEFYRSIYAAEFLSWYLGIRTIMVPGSFTIHYLEFFSFRGFTGFSHIRGLDLLMGVPPEFAADGRWPAIGLIVGEDYFNYPSLNASANFIAWDGVASLGLIGIPVITIVFGFFLKVLDKVSAEIGPLALLLLMPVGLTLTNGSLFTVLTSFGGLLWIALFHFCFARPDGEPGVTAVAPVPPGRPALP